MTPPRHRPTIATVNDDTYEELGDHLPDAGLRALAHMRMWNPAQLDALEDPESYFTMIANQVDSTLKAARATAERAVPPELTGQAREGWINMAVFNAQSEVESELIYCAPEGVDPDEDEWDDDDPDDRERHRRWDWDVRSREEMQAWEDVFEVECELEDRRDTIREWPAGAPIPNEYLEETVALEDWLHQKVAEHDAKYPDFEPYKLGFPGPEERAATAHSQGAADDRPPIRHETAHPTSGLGES